MSLIIKQTIKELKKLRDNPKNVKDYSRFFKEKKDRISVSVPILRKLARDYYRKIRDLEKAEVLKTCDELLASKISGSKIVAFDWSYRIKNKYEEKDFKIFEKWLKEYIKAWDDCDDLCTHSLGYLIWKYPKLISKTKKWITSNNLWLRRSSAVAMIYSARREENLDFCFKVAEKLLEDKEDLVQKGYGWMLKEISNKQEKRVFDFVMKHKSKIPRTALRYAVEKMPLHLKKKAMKK